MKDETSIIVGLAVLAISFTVACVTLRGCHQNAYDAGIQRAAIEKGYVQDVKDGQVIWVRERNDDPECSNLK